MGIDLVLKSLEPKQSQLNKTEVANENTEEQEPSEDERRERCRDVT